MKENRKSSIHEFLRQNTEYVKTCFTSNQFMSRPTLLRRLQSLIFRIKKRLFEIGCLFFLSIVEPSVVSAQFALRKNGGLKGFYQFHRLFEIRQFIRSNKMASVIEFGSGASTILFMKYIKDFISIEESEEWMRNYIRTLQDSKLVRKEFPKRLQAIVKVLPRIEFQDSTGEVVCSYLMPEELISKRYDLAYIDGPTSWLQNQNLLGSKVRDPFGSIPNSTALELSFMPRFLIIDGRRATVSYFIEKGNISQKAIKLKGSYRKKLLVQPYHTIILNYNITD